MQELNPREWVDRYSDLLFRYALLRINDREQARDAERHPGRCAVYAKPPRKAPKKRRRPA